MQKTTKIQARRKAPPAPARARTGAGAKKPVSEIVTSASPDQRRTWMDALGSQPMQIAGSIDQAAIVPAMYAAWGAYGYQPAITWYQLANMFTSWEYTATEKIARTIAGLPAKLYRYENASGKTLKPHYVKSLIYDDVCKHRSAQIIQRKLKKEHGIQRFEIDDHPFLDLIAQPNDDMVRFNFWRLLCIHLELNGAVGIYKALRDGFGNPQQLHILPTTWTGQLKPMPATDGVNLIKGYMLLDQDIHTVFDRDEIMWIHYTSLRNPYEGMSAIKAQLYAFNMDQYLMQQISAYYKNGAMFSNVFKTEQQLTQDQYNSIAGQLANYAGAKNAGQKFILHSGLDMVNNTTSTAREAMIDEIENMARDKLLSSHDVSAGKIGLVASQNRSNLDTVDMGFFNESIKPRAMLITEYFDRFIVNNYDPNIDFEFDYPHFQDRAMDIQERNSNISNGITTRNEERDKMGLEPVEGGDIILISPMNAPLADVANPPPPPTPAPASGAPAGIDGDEGEGKPAPADEQSGEGAGEGAADGVGADAGADAGNADGKPAIGAPNPKADQHTKPVSKDLKGGEGSGDFGHYGRPGIGVGGSAPSGFDRVRERLNDSQEGTSEKSYGFEWHHCRKVFWTPDKKAIAWKKFDREAKAYESLFKRVMVKFFRDMAAATTDLIEKHGVKIKSNIGAMSFNGRQKWLADHKDRLGELIPAKAEMVKRLKQGMQPVYYTVVDAAGKEQADEFLKLLGKHPKVKAKVEGDAGEVEMEYGFEFNVNDPAVKEWIGERLDEFSEITAQTTIDATRSVLREDFENGEPLMKMGEHLREYYTDAETYRANLIARTETTSAMNKGDLEAVDQMGLGDAVGKVWLAEPDAATRPTHIQAGERYSDGYDSETGDPMTIDREFVVGDDKMLHPAGGSLAEENCNCRCGLVYEILGDRGDRGTSDAADFGGEGEKGFKGVDIKTYEDHPGRPCEQGGSLPKGSGANAHFDKDLDPDAAVLAKARDSKNRPQAIYNNELWNDRQAAKFERVWELNDEKVSEIRADLDKSIKAGKDVEEASCLRLVAATGLRPGSEKDTKAEKQAFGATTLYGKDIVGDNPSNVRLVFGGKSGKDLDLPVEDKVVARDLLARREAAGADQKIFNTDADKLSNYSQSQDGGGFFTKDFRTSLGTRTALHEREKYPKPKDQKEYKAAVKAIATTVSQKLGNTPKVALTSYIHPAVWADWSIK